MGPALSNYHARMNVFLERKGHKHVLRIMKGFEELLLIGNQSHPNIFNPNTRRPLVYS